MRTPRTALAACAVLAPLASACPTDPDGEPAAPGECDEAWGAAPASGRLHVSADADDGSADGSAESPFSSLDPALAAARLGRQRQIAIGPGDFDAWLVLSQGVPDWADGGLDVAGCGRDRTTLHAVEAPDPWNPGNDIAQPVLDIAGADTAGIRVHDLALSGGRRSIVIRDGAGSAGAIAVERVDIAGSLRVGVLLDGWATVAHLLDVAVAGVSSEGGSYGWGIAIQTGAEPGAPPPSPTVLSGVSVEDAVGVGILLDGGWLDATGVDVRDVAAQDGGELGRGVQFQNRSWGTLDSLLSEGNSDAAVYLHKPGRDGEAVDLLDCELRGTAPAAIPGAAGEESGDGLSISQGQDGQAVDSFLVRIEGTRFEGNPRAHLLAEGVTVELGSDSIFGKDTQWPIAAQDGAVVMSIGGEMPAAATEFAEGDALPLNRDAVGTDALLE